MKLSQKTVRTSLVFLIIAATALALYYHMANKMSPTDETVTITPVQNVLLKNLDQEYPATPREVMKYYNQLQECLYNETYSDEEFQQLAQKQEAMFDEELLANQDEAAFLAGLKTEIDAYHSATKKISDSWVSSSTDVDYYTYQNRDCANIRCIYTTITGSKSQITNEIYVLRKDQKGHWKILGWQLDNGATEATEES